MCEGAAVVAEIVVECFGADFEEGCHVYLCFVGICGEEGGEFGIFEGGANTLLRGRCVDFGIECFGDADANAFFTD